MNRFDFECLSTKKRRIIAERQYHIVSKLLFQAEHDNGIYSDEFGPITEIHHCWPRAHCPLWFTFQPENLMPVSRQLHYALHNIARSDMNEIQASYYDECERVRTELIAEDAKYHYPQKYHANEIQSINGTY